MTTNNDINVTEEVTGQSGTVVATAAQATLVKSTPEQAAQVKLVRQQADGIVSYGSEIDANLQALQTRDESGYRYVKFVMDFVEKMNARPRVSEIAELHRRLLVTLKNAPRFAQAEFNLTWGTILAIVAQNRTEGKAFHETSILQLMSNDEYFTLQERKTFTRLINLVIHTCTPAARINAVKHINFTDTLGNDFTSEEASRVTAFYSA